VPRTDPPSAFFEHAEIPEARSTIAHTRAALFLIFFIDVIHPFFNAAYILRRKQGAQREALWILCGEV
jgi:hypothetical protein